MPTHRIPIIRPDIPKTTNKHILTVILHLAQHIDLANIGYLENVLQCNNSQLGLEKISSVQTVQTIRTKHPRLLRQHTISLHIVNVTTQIDLHLPQTNDHLVHSLKIIICIKDSLPLTLA